MEFLSELWNPILVSGVGCFVVSALAWTALPHHKSELRRLPTEPEVLEALRRHMPPPGLYTFPFSVDRDKDRADIKVALQKGPVGFVTIGHPGRASTGKMMIQMLVYFMVSSFLIAYVAWHAKLGLGAPFLAVFRIVGTIATMTYALGAVPESIWFARPWKSFGLQLADSLAYGLVTAGIFGVLWPK